MSRHLIAAIVALVTPAGLLGAAHAQPAPDPGSSAPDVAPSSPAAEPASPIVGHVVPAPGPAASSAVEAGDDLGDQAISAQLGAAAGGRVTPGGLRIAGHYLYQLADQDWFDGAASFTFGSGGGACFRDRMDTLVCSHGLSDGTGVELSASVRRVFAPQGAFRPFARLGVGLGLVRFGGDDVSGVTVPAHAGGGVRVTVAPSVALVADGELTLGFGSFNRGLGSEIQFGLAVTAGAEFRLR